MSAVKQIKEVFGNLGEVVKVALISLIPILNFTVAGYVIKIARNKMKNRKLPKFEVSSSTFVDGFFVFVISFIYGLITLFLIAPFKLLSSVEDSLESIIVYGVIDIVIRFIVYVFILGAILRFAEKKKLSEAFNFSKIANKVFTSKFVVEYVKNLIISGLISIPGILVVIVSVVLFLVNLMPTLLSVLALLASIFVAVIFVAASSIYFYSSMAVVYRKVK